jgi:hypothetical protein
MSKFKRGDTVRVKPDAMDKEGHSFVPSMRETLGKVGVISDAGTSNCCVLFADGDEWCYQYPEIEIVATSYFIINGAPKEYPTLEAAEAGVKAIGNNGVTYEIAQIVKRVTVKRETVVTLEETV